MKLSIWHKPTHDKVGAKLGQGFPVFANILVGNSTAKCLQKEWSIGFRGGELRRDDPPGKNAQGDGFSAGGDRGQRL